MIAYVLFALGCIAVPIVVMKLLKTSPKMFFKGTAACAIAMIINIIAINLLDIVLSYIFPFQIIIEFFIVLAVAMAFIDTLTQFIFAVKTKKAKVNAGNAVTFGLGYGISTILLFILGVICLNLIFVYGGSGPIVLFADIVMAVWDILSMVLGFVVFTRPVLVTVAACGLTVSYVFTSVLIFEVVEKDKNFGLAFLLRGIVYAMLFVIMLTEASTAFIIIFCISAIPMIIYTIKQLRKDKIKKIAQTEEE